MRTALRCLAAAIFAAATVGASAAPVAALADVLTIEHAVWFEVDGQRFVSVEVVSDDPTSTITAELDAGVGTDIGDGPTVPLVARTADGFYISHQVAEPHPIDDAPATLRVTSDRGGSADAPVTEWLEDTPTPPGSGYIDGLVTGLHDPLAHVDALRDLATEFPHIAQFVELPERSGGYQRRARATVGGADAGQRIVVTSQASGHLGGNALAISVTDPGVANSPLTVALAGNAVTLSVATNAAGDLSSTAAQAVAALNAHPGVAAILTAATFRGSVGAGIVQPTPSTALTDGLDAPATIPRGPVTMGLLRIGLIRDGSKPGVLVAGQETGRDAASAAVAMETAERLLRNYGTDPATTQLVDGLDIFIVPSVNVDGGLYAAYDFADAIKNLRETCSGSSPDDGDSADLWGVSLLHGYSVGSTFDGFLGGTSACDSLAYAGPFELSEPEARNMTWIASTFPNIAYAATVDMFAPTLAWSPGARTPSGVTLPAPAPATETFLERAAEHVGVHVQARRGSTLFPADVGWLADVQESRSGNLLDELAYSRGIKALEIGGALHRWDGTDWVADPVTTWDANAQAAVRETSDGLTGYLGFILDVELGDHDPPTIDPMPDLALATVDPAGAVATFDLPGATDAVDPSPTVSCTPPSGSTFPPGTTTVTCTATDASGNEASTDFEVTVTLVPVGTIVCDEAQSGQTVSCSFTSGPPDETLHVLAQADTVIGDFDVTTDSSGDVAFELSIPSGLEPGSSVTVTITLGELVVGQASLTLTAPPMAQAITFAPLEDRVFGVAPFDVTATASSGLPVTFAAAGTCTVSGATVTLTGAGECTITASQPGDDEWLAASPVARTFAVGPASTATVVTGPDDLVVAGEPVVVVATVTSGAGTPTGSVTFTATPDGGDGAATATVDLVDGTATWVAEALPVGTHTITAAYLGAGDHAPSTGGEGIVVTVISSDDDFVRRTYRAVLSRTVDAAGLAYWTGRLDGGANRAVVADAIARGVEGRVRLVTLSYLRVLGRAPEPAGLAHWVDQLVAGLPPEGLTAHLVASSEAHERAGGTPEGMATLLYEVHIGRVPDPAGLAYWAARLSAPDTPANRSFTSRAMGRTAEAAATAVRRARSPECPTDTSPVDLATRYVATGRHVLRLAASICATG